MSLERSLQETGAGLISVRATERKKNAETLKNYLTGNAAPSLLSNNTLKKKGYDWNNLFDDVNEYILKELEKYESSKTFFNITAPLCTSILHLCVTGSNKGHAYISCDRLMEACMYVLKDKRMATAIGDAYLNLLYKHVVPYDHYVSFITPTIWEDLLDVCIDATLTKHTKLDSFTLLRLIWLLIKKGKSCCQLIIPLRNALPRLKTCFLRVESDKKIQEIITEITILLLEMLSSESRLTMCEFTESVLAFLLKCYDQNADHKKKSGVFRLLHLIIILHHPGGQLQNEEASMAYDWDVWNKYLLSIMDIVCLEMNYLQKLRRHNDQSLKYYIYYRLAASVYFQTFNLHINDNNEALNSSKRQRVSLNNYKCFSDLVEELRLNHVPWLGITYIYVQDYGSSVKTLEITALLSVVESLISNNLPNFDWDIFEKITCLVLQKIIKERDYDQEGLYRTMTMLWNSCVWNSSSENDAHRSIHGVMQCLLELNVLEYQNVQPLIKLYFEKGMPVTDPSIRTLSSIYQKFYNKCSYTQDRKKCFEWFTQGNVSLMTIETVKDFLLRLVTNNNFTAKENATEECRDGLYEKFFDSTEKCILFSEGVADLPNETIVHPHVDEPAELNGEMADQIQEYLQDRLSVYMKQLDKNEIPLLEFAQNLRLVITYVDIILRVSSARRSRIEENELYCSLRTGLTVMCKALGNSLKEMNDIRDKRTLLQCIHGLWLTDYDPVIDSLVRNCADQDFFSKVNEILNVEVSRDDEAVYEENDAEYNPAAARHGCVALLAAYCRKNSEYREEILDLILDPVLYDFTSTWDIKCAFQCIKILADRNVTECPLASIFTLLRNMCQRLFRNSEATETILEILLELLERVWAHDVNMRQNCVIMVKGYLQRCEHLYYPPHVAALIYKCVANISKIDVDCAFKDSLIDKLKGKVFSLRLYACYLLNNGLDSETEFLNSILDIFVIDVPEANQSILKDERRNRTLTVLHCFLAFVKTKQSSIREIVNRLLEIQKEKSLDVILVKKFLNKITKTITSNDLETYLQNNILSIIHFWLSKRNEFEELPLYVFGYQNINTFLEKHMKWLISADILWFNEGSVKNSNVLTLIKSHTGRSEEAILEQCFSNIIVLCLPYIVTEKYNLRFTGAQQSTAFKQSMKNAIKMFQMTRQILENEKWSSLFVENMSELLLMATMHLHDQEDAKELFQVNFPNTTASYLYPKIVFNSILKYFGELIEGNIMQYLCSDQAVTIFDILIKLWETYLKEKVFEYRAMCLYRFVTFAGCVPLGFDSDAFVCNFTCNSLTHVLKISRNKEEVRVLAQALGIILRRYSPGAIALIRQSVLKARSVLLIKTEEGYKEECEALLNYFAVGIEGHLLGSEDLVDFGNVSHGAMSSCATTVEFCERLKAYNFTLTCPSHESLIHLRQFVKLNKHHAISLCDELNTKRFSEECKTSVIHQIIFALSNILKSSSDDKIIIEACNCLSEIGTYDLKTVVTVPPPDTDRVVHLPPKQCFAFAAVDVLSEVLSDEHPAVTNKAVMALNDIFKYREGKDALELADVNVQLLKPFLSPGCNDTAEFRLSSQVLERCSDTDFWALREKEDQERWLTRITTSLLDILASATNYLKTLRDVCIMKPTISRRILPCLVGLLLHCLPEMYISTFSDQINNFFKYIWKMNFDDELDSSGNRHGHKVNVIDRDHKMVIQYMLDVVNCVRLQRTHYKTRRDRTPLDSHNYLRLDYDKVAWAASMAGQNLVAIYYGELWAVARNGGVPPSSPEVTSSLVGGDNVQRMFRKCYVSIGEMDAISGCGSAHLTSEDEIRKHLIDTGQYTDALLSHDIALSGPGAPQELRVGVVRSLHKSGLYHLALQYIQSLPESDHINDIKYDCLTGLGDWSTFVDTRDLEEKSKSTPNPLSMIKAFRYACLRDCFNLQTSLEFQSKLSVPLNRAKLAVSRWCRNLNMENCQSVYRVVANLHLFTDIEDYFLVRCDKLPITSLLNNWRVEKLPPFHDFKHLEPLISQRTLILEHAGKANKNFLKDIVPLQLQYVELGLNNDRVQMAQRLLSIAKKMQNTDSVSLVEGQVSWAKDHKEVALALVRNVMGNRSANVELTAASLRQYGMWMAESKCENPRDIIDTFLKKSLDVLGESDHMQTRLKVYYDIAKFADSEYKQVVSYMNSSIFEHKLKCMESMKGTADSMKSTQPSLLSKDERKVLATTKGLYTLDEAEIANTKAEKLRYLHLAMRYYLLSLQHSEENNLSVFRVISLWLANPAPALAGGGGELLRAVPARKFLAVLPQLAPRLAADGTPFAADLTRILERCAQEHPHHTLPILFSLRNSDKDLCILNAARGGAGRARPLEPRAAAAAALIAGLSARGPPLAALVAQTERLCDAIISFANFKTQLKEPKQKIPSAELIHRLGALRAVPVPVDAVPVRADCDYSRVPTIVGFENYFELVGGINCPKKIICRGSDGRNRIVLVKGEDDLRQDAVMQQVFNIVNTLLEKNPVTRRNKLLIRTYKVVPMSRQSGVLEWCEGTLPLGDYLVGRSNNGAHARYRPQDISCTAARMKFTSAARKPQSEKLKIFLDILKDFKPVFHNFFTEQYLDPVTWYERRLAYTKSVATSSMVGYILGLGDRHVQNILIDKKTAEVIHIDFGIAFDQGRALPTPETIPFRLTQDMIAGFGSSGVEGIFRKSCEKTMQLLRDNHETLLTILEVLLCDPFYSWTTKKIAATTKDSNVNVASPKDSVADLAERTLLAVGSKLSGTEAGAAGGVAVPGQVARLLHCATDPANLCRLFQGWQPYL